MLQPKSNFIRTSQLELIYPTIISFGRPMQITRRQYNMRGCGLSRLLLTVNGHTKRTIGNPTTKGADIYVET